MNWLDRLLNGVCNPRKDSKPVFHENTTFLYGDGEYISMITSGGKEGWFTIADEPICKIIYIEGVGSLQLSGRYSKYGNEYAVETKEKQFMMPTEFIGLRIYM